jgi:hypothetical protein
MPEELRPITLTRASTAIVPPARRDREFLTSIPIFVRASAECRPPLSRAAHRVDPRGDDVPWLLSAIGCAAAGENPLEYAARIMEAALELRHLRGLTLTAVASALGRSTAAVGSLLDRGLKMPRE